MARNSCVDQLAEAGPIADRVQPAVLPDCTLHVEQSRSLAKLEQPVEVKLVLGRVRALQFAICDKERGFTAERGGLDLDETLPAVGVERQDVVAQPIPLGFGDMLDPVREQALARLYQAPVFIVQCKLLAGQSQRLVLCLAFQIDRIFPGCAG